MGELLTMVRTEIRVNGHAYLLAQGEDIPDLKRQIRAATTGSGDFVEFTVAGNRAVSVLITRTTEVTLSSQTVREDPRDDADEDLPYADPFEGI